MWLARSSGASEQPSAKEAWVQCEICASPETSNSNVIILCDGCDLAVHQECYGVPHVPEGSWLCRKCLLHAFSRCGSGSASSLNLLHSASSHESGNEIEINDTSEDYFAAINNVEQVPLSLCVLCPWPDGALKQTTDRRWVHSVCAKWCPEAVVLNTTYQEPVDLSGIPQARWSLKCVLCTIANDPKRRQPKGTKTSRHFTNIESNNGAPMQCGHESCAVAFHPLCARAAGWFLDYGRSEGWCGKHQPMMHQQLQEIDVVSDKPLPPVISPAASNLEGKKFHGSWPKIVIEACPPLHSTRSKSTNSKSVSFIIPQKILGEAQKTFSLRRDLLAKMARYWSLKRQARRGIPLLRGLPDLPHTSIKNSALSLEDQLVQEYEAKKLLKKHLQLLEQIFHLRALRERKRLASLELTLTVLKAPE